MTYCTFKKYITLIKFRDMKKLILLTIIILFISCNTSSNNAPDVCECIQNIVKMSSDNFDKELDQKCQEYSSTLSQEDRVERAMEGLECLK